MICEQLHLDASEYDICSRLLWHTLNILSKSRSVRGEAFKQPNPPDDGSRIIEPAVAIMVGPAVPSATFQG